MQVFLLVLLASRLQSHSPCVFPPVLLSLFSFQSVLSLPPSPGRLFLFAQFPGWLCLPTVGFKSLPGRPPFSSDPAFWSELFLSFSFLQLSFCIHPLLFRDSCSPSSCLLLLGTLREIVFFALLLWCVMRRNESRAERQLCSFRVRKVGH